MLCQAHEDARVEKVQRNDQRDRARVINHGLVEGLLGEDPVVSWQRAIRILVAMGDDIPLEIRRQAAYDYYRHPRTRELDGMNLHGIDMIWRRFRNYWHWAVNGQVGPEPVVLLAAMPPQPVPRPQGLAALARDNQNVHTQVVTTQTNTAIEKLLAMKVPETQQTEKTLVLVWLGGMNLGYASVLRVANDINRWFNTKDCRVVGDNLYRRLLRGLVALIASEKDDERKTEMYRRAWEECNESVGMCCEGHISRLCNVLVGFDEAFKPPVPFGEILQSKMAAIAGLDVPDEEKRRQANAFFDEHQTPAEDRVAWLEAF